MNFNALTYPNCLLKRNSKATTSWQLCRTSNLIMLSKFRLKILLCYGIWKRTKNCPLLLTSTNFRPLKLWFLRLSNFLYSKKKNRFIMLFWWNKQMIKTSSFRKLLMDVTVCSKCTHCWIYLKCKQYTGVWSKDISKTRPWLTLNQCLRSSTVKLFSNFSKKIQKSSSHSYCN